MPETIEFDDLAGSLEPSAAAILPNGAPLSEHLAEGRGWIAVMHRWQDESPSWLVSLIVHLIAFLMAHPDEVFSREVLLDKVWGWTFADQSTVTVHVKRIRTKLGPTAHIDTVWGRGYRWTSASTRESSP